MGERVHVLQLGVVRQAELGDLTEVLQVVEIANADIVQNERVEAADGRQLPEFAELRAVQDVEVLERRHLNESGEGLDGRVVEEDQVANAASILESAQIDQSSVVLQAQPPGARHIAMAADVAQVGKDRQVGRADVRDLQIAGTLQGLEPGE